MHEQLLWFMEEDVDTAFCFGELLLGDAKLGVGNTHQLALAEYELQNAANVLNSSDIPLPAGFPAPRLALPAAGFAPDYLSFSGYYFCSSRLRDALAQPAHVVQYAPVELVSGGLDAQMQDYQLRRVLARQGALDLERTECRLEDFTNRVTGQSTKRPRNVRRFVLRDGFTPRTDIFRLDEAATYVLVTDEVAARVQAAECTGIAFADPANRQSGKRVDRYRTLDGIAEQRVGFLD